MFKRVLTVCTLSLFMTPAFSQESTASFGFSIGFPFYFMTYANYHLNSKIAVGPRLLNAGGMKEFGYGVGTTGFVYGDLDQGGVFGNIAATYFPAYTLETGTWKSCFYGAFGVGYQLNVLKYSHVKLAWGNIYTPVNGAWGVRPSYGFGEGVLEMSLGFQL